MNRGQILKARAAAALLIEKCDAAIDRIDRHKTENAMWDARHEARRKGLNEEAAVKASTPKASPGDRIYSSKETAALRRNSLDLTRTLAELRKP